MIDHEKFDECFEKFMDGRPEGLPFTAQDSTGKWSLAAVVPLLLKYTELFVLKSGGHPSVSAFQIILGELIADGQVKPIALEPQISHEIAEFIRKAEAGQIGTYELKRRYMSDRNFRDAYDQHAGLAVQPKVSLSAEEYRRIPVAQAQRRYRQDVGFKAAVDKLFASGQV
jgi:hypothetical protein